MVNEITSKSNYVQAFPLELEVDVRHVLPMLMEKPRHWYAETEEVTLSGETLKIPNRIYYEEPDPEQIASLTAKQQLILFALYTRHHNGYVREKYLRKIIPHAEEHSWITPYLLRLVGEYVEEIIQVIYGNLSLLNADFIKAFIRENTSFYRLLQSRVASYWNEYYRWKYQVKDQYVGFQVLEFVRQLLKEPCC